MAVPGNQPDDVETLETGQGPSWLSRLSLPRSGLSLAIVALGIGLLLGYLAGRHDAGTPVAQPSPPVATPVTGASADSASTGPPILASTPPVARPSAITLADNTCAVQKGHRIELGMEITNETPTAVTIRKIRAHLPLRGLRPTGAAFGTCGQLGPGPDAFPSTAVAAHATAWVTMSFDVLVSCPGAIPVEFRVRYERAGQVSTAILDGFPDLGQLRYSGCHED